MHSLYLLAESKRALEGVRSASNSTDRLIRARRRARRSIIVVV